MTKTDPAVDLEPTLRSARGGFLRDLDWRRYVIYIGFVVVFAFFAVLLGDQGFLSPNNLLNILSQTATIAVVAVGMTFVISAAEITNVIPTATTAMVAVWLRMFSRLFGERKPWPPSRIAKKANTTTKPM